MRPTRLGGTMPGAKRDLAGFLVNPRVEIVGYLHDYSEIVPSELLNTLTTAVFEHLDSLPDEMEMHDIICFVSLAETASLPQPYRDRIWAKLAKAGGARCRPGTGGTRRLCAQAPVLGLLSGFTAGG